MAYKNFTNCTEEQYYEIIYSQDDTNRIKILFNNVELADADEYCEKLTVKNRILPDDGSKRFSLGNFVSKEAELILRDLPSTTVIQDQVSISIGTLVNESNDTYEYVPIGIFNIQDTPVTDQNKVTIKLRDNRVKFDYYYNAKPLIDEKGGTASYYQILDDICTQAGVTNKVGHFAGDDIEVSIYDNTITATSYVAKIAEQCGMIPVINRLGELEFINPKSDKATTQIENTTTLQNVGSTQIDNIELIGNTTQEGTPTPSSPQEVVNVTGLQEIKAVGKNLFNGTGWRLVQSGNGFPTPATGATIVSSDENNISFTSTQWTYAGVESGFIKVKANETYMLSAKFTTPTNRFFITQYDENKARISTLNNVTTLQNTSFTTTNDGYIAIAFTNTTTSQTTYKIEDIQIEKGSTATSYEPYQEQANKINLGKNLYYPELVPFTNMKIDTGLKLNQLWATTVIPTTNIHSLLKHNTTYTCYAKYSCLNVPSSFGQYESNNKLTLYRASNEGGTVVTPLVVVTNKTEEGGISCQTFTTPNDLTNCRVLGYSFKDTSNNTVGIVELTNLMIVEGTYTADTIGEYSEYFTPIELCKIGTYEDKIFKTSGKNLFDEEIELGSINPADGSLAENNSRTRSKNYIKVQPSTTYTFTRTITGGYRWIIGYKADKTGIADGNYNGYASALGGSDLGQLTFTFTTSSTTQYIKWYDTSSTNLTEQVMISEGTTQIEYEPYSNNEWYVKKAIGKVVLNGSENWQNWSTTDTNYSHYQLDNAFVYNNTSGADIRGVCNFYPVKVNGNPAEISLGLRQVGDSVYRIYLTTLSTLSTLSDFKTWLSTHNTILYYVLATPTYEKLNDTLQEELENACYGMLSYKGQTNIMVESNILPFIVNAVVIEQ